MGVALKNGVVWFDGPAEGAWNMAMDQAMLQYATENDCIVLRIYQWSEPTLSLGYFQDYQDRHSVPKAENISCVRRVTGGGAILHDQEITYSLALPRSLENQLPKDFHSPESKLQQAPGKASQSKLGHSETLYRVVHANVAKWLLSMGFDASAYDSQSTDLHSPKSTVDTNSLLINSQGHAHGGLQSSVDHKAFLCFDRRSDVDIIVKAEVAGSVAGSDIQGNKVLGSAQRRSKAALLQHGSLLLGPSAFAPHLLGLNVFAEKAKQEPAKSLDAKSTDSIIWNWAIDFCGVLQDSIEQIWDCHWKYMEQPNLVVEATNRIKRERFQCEDWTVGKRMPAQHDDEIADKSADENTNQRK